jgi:hypothetical protein
MLLEPIDPRHTDTAALVRGPLVLMAVKPDAEAPVPVLSRSELLSARRTGSTEWRAGTVRLAPFTALANRAYTAYVNLT